MASNRERVRRGLNSAQAALRRVGTASNRAGSVAQQLSAARGEGIVRLAEPPLLGRRSPTPVGEIPDARAGTAATLRTRNRRVANAARAQTSTPPTDTSVRTDGVNRNLPQEGARADLRPVNNADLNEARTANRSQLTAQGRSRIQAEREAMARTRRMEGIALSDARSELGPSATPEHVQSRSMELVNERLQKQPDDLRILKERNQRKRANRARHRVEQLGGAAAGVARQATPENLANKVGETVGKVVGGAQRGYAGAAPPREAATLADGAAEVGEAAKTGRDKVVEVYDKGKAVVEDAVNDLRKPKPSTPDAPARPGIARRAAGAAGRAVGGAAKVGGVALAPVELLAAGNQYQRLREGGLSSGQSVLELGRQAGEGLVEAVKHPIDTLASLPEGIANSFGEATDFLARQNANEYIEGRDPFVKGTKYEFGKGVQLTAQGRNAGHEALARRAAAGDASAAASLRRLGDPRFGDYTARVSDTDGTNAPAPVASPAPEVQPDAEVSDALADLRTGVEQGAPLADARTNPDAINYTDLEPGTGFTQVNRGGQPVPGRGSVLDLRGAPPSGGSGKPPKPRGDGDDGDRFNLRRFIDREREAGRLNPLTAGIAQGAETIARRDEGSMSPAERVDAVNAQASGVRAVTERMRASGELDDKDFNRATTVMEGIVSENPQVRDASITRGLQATGRVGELARSMIGNQVRSAFEDNGLLDIILPRFAGGAGRNAFDALASFIDGDPQVDLAGAFKGFTRSGDDLYSSDGQKVISLGELDNQTAQQAIRELVPVAR